MSIPEAEIKEWVRNRLASALGIAPSEFNMDASFVDLGLDSVTLFSMTGELAEWLDRDLPATLLFESMSVNKLIAALASLEPTGV